MKRTLWSILAATAAALLPGLVGPTVDLAAPMHDPPLVGRSASRRAPPSSLGFASFLNSVKPVAEAIAPKKAEVREALRAEDERDDDPCPPVQRHAVAEVSPLPVHEFAPRIHAASPDVAPLARRSLGRPRVRAPDRTA